MLPSSKFTVGLIIMTALIALFSAIYYRPFLPFFWPSFMSGWLMVLLIAFSLGTMEAAWTGPGRGGPLDTWKGILGIYIVFFILTFPMVWLVPLLAIVEEASHGFLAYEGWKPTKATILNHWSISYIGFNIYPWATFPLIALLGEIVYRLIAL